MAEKKAKEQAEQPKAEVKDEPWDGPRPKAETDPRLIALHDDLKRMGAR